jgi:phosphoribosylformylglycinamidine (FGAM) synthase-like amidotransferase family enzyme
MRRRRGWTESKRGKYNLGICDGLQLGIIQGMKPGTNPTAM